MTREDSKSHMHCTVYLIPCHPLIEKWSFMKSKEPEESNAAFEQKIPLLPLESDYHSHP